MTRRTSRHRRSSPLRRNSHRLTDMRSHARDCYLANVPGWGKEILRAWSNVLVTDAVATKHVLAMLAMPEYEMLAWNIRRSVIQILADTGFPEETLSLRHRGIVANSTRYTTRSPAHPRMQVDEHSSEAEIVQAWRSGRLGISTLQRVRVAQPAVYSLLVRLTEEKYPDPKPLRRNSRRLADLMRQGFMKPLKQRKGKKVEKPIVACEDCMNWHREGKHTSSPAVRKERRAARGAPSQQRRL